MALRVLWGVLNITLSFQTFSDVLDNFSNLLSLVIYREPPLNLISSKTVGAVRSGQLVRRFGSVWFGLLVRFCSVRLVGRLVRFFLFSDFPRSLIFVDLMG